MTLISCGDSSCLGTDIKSLGKSKGNSVNKQYICESIGAIDLHITKPFSRSQVLLEELKGGRILRLES